MSGYRLVPFLIALSIAQPIYAGSDGLDQASADALQKAQELLRDPAQRRTALGASKESKEAGLRVESLAGNQANTQEMYEIASLLFEELIRRHNGDSVAAMTELNQAMANPVAFAQNLSPQVKQRIQALARKIPEPNRETAGSYSNPRIR